MATLSRDAILNSADLPMEKIHIPEWGGDVYIRTICAGDRDSFEESISSGAKDRKSNMKNFRARLAVLCCVDASGNRLFTENDIEALGKKSCKALDRILTVSRKLNGFSDNDVEELVKNSAGTPDDALPSA